MSTVQLRGPRPAVDVHQPSMSRVRTRLSLLKKVEDPVRLVWTTGRDTLSHCLAKTTCKPDVLTMLRWMLFTPLLERTIKQMGYSPDSFIKIGLSRRHSYKVRGCLGAHYETGFTRQFKHGRTEVIRTCTRVESVW